MSSIKHLVIGYGQIGKAIKELLREHGYWVEVEDKVIYAPLYPPKQYGTIHICFPYSDDFISEVKRYQADYSHEKTITIIHSTVKIGTSRKLGAVYSPVRGVHPHLLEGLKTFVKYFAGKDAVEASALFGNMKTYIHQGMTDLEDLEAAKLVDTTQYGMMIMLNKMIYKWCVQGGLDFDIVYTRFNETYNKGYIELGMNNVVRPVLKYTEGKIGGHCVESNARILDSDLAKLMLKLNEEFK